MKEYDEQEKRNMNSEESFKVIEGNFVLCAVLTLYNYNYTCMHIVTLLFLIMFA